MIKNENEIDPLHKLALQDFSYTRLNTFEECQARYFYSYVLKEPQDFGAPALMGNVIHKALEVTLEDGQKINLRELLDNYKAALEDHDPDGYMPEQLIVDGEEMLRQFVDNFSEEIEIYAKELPFSFILGPARFNGFIDVVSVYPSRVVIRDYKSGKQEVAYKNIQSNLQVGIYSLYAKKLFPDKEIYAELYYLRTGKAKGHLFTDDDLLQVESILLDKVNSIIATENFTTTSNERACRWCSYGKNGVCPTGQLRLRRQNLLID
jgi:RecB family exonuclease